VAATPDNPTTTRRTSFVRIVITKDNMSVMMAISDPRPSGNEVTFQDVRDEIERAGVVYGIDWDVVSKSLDEHLYDTPVKIASGLPPKRGQDARFEFAIDREQEHSPVEQEDGSIDYRSINFIQNVEEGTVLIRKIPATEGEPGTAVDGTELPGMRGRDFGFCRGTNTRVSEDGLELVAAKSGAIVFTPTSVSVNDVTTIKGDVDMSVGNLDCIGSVCVQGEVQAGFTLNVGGNLEVWGNVAECTINCKGNVLIKGGCFGKGDGEGTISAAGDVVAKYAEGLTITAGNDILMGEELLNCKVVAQERVIVSSRKGKIIGGETNAGKEIRTAVAGANAGTGTILRAGYNAELINRHRQASEEVGRLRIDAERVKQTLYEIYKEQGTGELDPHRAKIAAQLEDFRASVPAELERLQSTLEDIENQLQEAADAVIVVTDTLFHGAVVYFGVVYREIADTVQRCQLTMFEGRVDLSSYTPER